MNSLIVLNNFNCFLNLCFSLQYFLFISNQYQSLLFQLRLSSQLLHLLPLCCFTSYSDLVSVRFTSILCSYLATFPHLGNLIVDGVATFPHLGNLVGSEVATPVHNLPHIFTCLCTFFPLLLPCFFVPLSLHISSSESI